MVNRSFLRPESAGKVTKVSFRSEWEAGGEGGWVNSHSFYGLGAVWLMSVCFVLIFADGPRESLGQGLCFR